MTKDRLLVADVLLNENGVASFLYYCALNILILGQATNIISTSQHISFKIFTSLADQPHQSLQSRNHTCNYFF